MRTSTGATVKRSKALRRTMSLPEALLWRQLRRRTSGFKFRHQHAAGPYVLDFYCFEAGLCVEVDGIAHEMGANPKRDEQRDRWLAERGIKTVRIPAEEILRDVEPVFILIQQECAARCPAKSSPAFAGEGDHPKGGGGAISAAKKPLHRASRGPPPPQKRGRI